MLVLSTFNAIMLSSQVEKIITTSIFYLSIIDFRISTEILKVRAKETHYSALTSKYSIYIQRFALLNINLTLFNSVKSKILTNLT